MRVAAAAVAHRAKVSQHGTGPGPNRGRADGPPAVSIHGGRLRILRATSVSPLGTARRGREILPPAVGLSPAFTEPRSSEICCRCVGPHRPSPPQALRAPANASRPQDGECNALHNPQPPLTPPPTLARSTPRGGAHTAGRVRAKKQKNRGARSRGGGPEPRRKTVKRSTLCPDGALGPLSMIIVLR